MTRLDLLKILVGQARANGFEFRSWYTGRLGLPWISAEAAITLLDSQRRYYALLFSHEFASTFWKPGADITFQVPAQTFQRTMPDGTITTVKRKPFTRRSSRPDSWRYHLREMAVSEEPLRYIRRYLPAGLTLDGEAPPEEIAPPVPVAPVRTSKYAPYFPKRKPRPLPKEPPAFLRRPYP